LKHLVKSERVFTATLAGNWYTGVHT